LAYGGITVTADGRILHGTRWYVEQIQGAKSTLIAGSTKEGGSSVDGPALSARFVDIEDIALDSSGRLQIADKHSLRLLDNGQVTTIAGAGHGYPPQDGPATTATFAWIRAVVDGPSGILVADLTTLRQIDSGLVTTLAGVIGTPYTVVDGPLDKARFTRILSLAIKQDVLYLVDWDYARRIRYVKDTVVTSNRRPARVQGGSHQRGALRFAPLPRGGRQGRPANLR